MTYTKRASEVFAGTDAGGNNRQISPDDARTWGTEVEVSSSFAVGASILSDTVANLPASADGTKAAVVNNGGNNGYYVRESSSWVKKGDLVGLTGPQGATGATGATGPAGPAGADGADGADGVTPDFATQGEVDAGTVTDKAVAPDTLATKVSTDVGAVQSALDSRINTRADGSVVIEDANGNVAVKVLPGGDIRLGTTRPVQIVLPSGATIAQPAAFSRNGKILFADDNGRAAGVVESDGTVVMDALRVRRPIYATPVSKSLTDWLKYDYLVITPYGQSWSVGTDAVPVINDVAVPGVVTFNGGPLQYESIAENAAALQSFEPGYERVVDGSLVPNLTSAMHGETSAVATAKHFLHLLEVENGLKYGRDHNTQILVNVPGRGSLTIDELSNPALPYINRFLEQMQRAVAIAAAEGKTIAFLAMPWLQGTNDAGDSATYAAQMVTLHGYYRDMATTTNTVLGYTGLGLDQPDPIMCPWVQPPVQNKGGTLHRVAQGVGERFFYASRANAGLVCIGSAYENLRVGAGNQHYRAQGQVQIGKNAAVAIKRAQIDGQTYEPLHVKSLTTQGRFVLIETSSTNILGIDSVRTLPIANLGLKFYQSDNTTEVAASSVELVYGNFLRATFANDATAALVNYVETANTGTDYLPANTWRTQIHNNGEQTTAGVDNFMVPHRFPEV